MVSNDDLLEWINKMPLWVRKATELFYLNNEITEENVKLLTDLCLNEDTHFLLTGVNLINHGDSSSFIIKKIQNISGVNAISSPIPLEFEDKGITVVYGLNGSGKSGYIRVLKMISGAKYREEIKNNIYEGKSVPPIATVTIKNEQFEKDYLCDLRIPGQYKELRDIDIFDSKISNAYVNDAKEATYEPWVFSLFSELANVAERIKSELKTREKEFVLKDYNYPKELIEYEPYKKIKSLTYNSKIEDFNFEWTNEHEDLLQEYRAKNQLAKIESDIKRLENVQKSIQTLEYYYMPIKQYFDNHEKYLELKANWDKARETREAAKLLFSQNATEIDAQGIKLGSWKKLWEYAQSFSNDSEYLKTKSVLKRRDGLCPLCLQPVNSDQLYRRIKTIDTYVNGKTAEEEKNTREAFERTIKFSFPVKTKNELDLLIASSELNDNSELLISVNNAIKEYSDFISSNPMQYDGRNIDISPVLTVLRNKYCSNAEIIQSMRKLTEAEEQQLLQIKINQMEATKAMVENKATIEYNINCLKGLYRLQQCQKKVSTNKITAKSKELAQELITEEYIKRFDDELKYLTKNEFEAKLIQQRAGKGKIPYKVVLSDANGNYLSPQDVLSEGENRVTALAAFFAEASGRSFNTPLVVDDPISSLDYLYENKVIDRLVRAATHRQVIVFTHRISMVVGIYDKAKEYNVHYKEISLKANKWKKGVPADNSDIGGKALTQINRLINDKLSKLKKMDEFSADYIPMFHSICQEFRNIVEKSVEDVLLNEVVKRFRRDIQTKNRLNKLVNITTEDCQMFDRLMTKYSYYDHSSSDETPLVEMPIDELEADLTELQLWISRHK